MTTDVTTADAPQEAASSAVAAVEAALDRIDASTRPEVWIRVRTRAEARSAALAVDAAFARGDRLPLRGLTVAVKDNIDVADLPTTAACPSFAFVPTISAPCVVALEQAGAVVIGKTNMDQFATGLVGTRSPHGAVASVVAAGHIGGGSSSGSAAAVALGLVDLALGTDTAGSGRVPAACQGIVGLKPTVGLVSVDGVLPACRSFDCVSVFARSVGLASRALDVLAQTSDRPTPLPVRTGGPVATIGVPFDGLGPLDPAFRTLFDAAVVEARRLGIEIVEIPFDLFQQAGALLYGGAFVAERHAAVGAFIDAHPDDIDPSVRTIIQSGAAIRAVDLIADQERLDHLKRRSRSLFETIDAVLVPTIPWHPTLDEVAADPIGANSRLGIFSFACNLLDLCAAAVPIATTPSGLPFGVTLMGPAGTDAAIAEVAARLTGEKSTEPVVEVGADEIRLAVAGAHLTGQPLNHQLTDLGARLVATTTTAPTYRLHALRTDPPKPGLVRVGPDGSGASIEVEVWSLPPEGFARFVAAVPPPLAIGQVELADGSWSPGFTCTPEALTGATDITRHGGWRTYLATLTSPTTSMTRNL